MSNRKLIDMPLFPVFWSMTPLKIHKTEFKLIDRCFKLGEKRSIFPVEGCSNPSKKEVTNQTYQRILTP